MTRRPTNLPRLDARRTAGLTRDEQPVLGARHVAILEAVREAGSLNAAAKALRISYRDAWGKIRDAEAELDVSLLASRTGGRRGGGSRLTAAAEQLLARLHGFQSERREASARAAARYFGGGELTQRRHGSERLTLATTTSVVDSGLLAVLLPPFQQRAGVAVDVVSVGSGAALRLARAGRADIVLAHAPDAEARAIAAGAVVNRRSVMRNQFVLLGPPDDPAGVRRVRAVGAALQRIAAAEALFLSRGDASGTHRREQQLLAAARITPGRWYRRAHAGMAALLRRADADRAYALADRGTLAALADSLALEVVCADDAQLVNVYSVLATNPHRHAGMNYLAAMTLIGWLTSPPAQELIAAYRVHGRRIAEPAAERATRGRR